MIVNLRTGEHEHEQQTQILALDNGSGFDRSVILCRPVRSGPEHEFVYDHHDGYQSERPQLPQKMQERIPQMSRLGWREPPSQTFMRA
jgi:hypothetical protein